MNVVIKISEDDRNKIEALHYQVESRANLLDRITSKVVGVDNAVTSFNTYMADYDKCYKEYVKLKNELEAKYKPEGNFISWSIDFQNSEMTFEGAEE